LAAVPRMPAIASESTYFGARKPVERPSQHRPTVGALVAILLLQGCSRHVAPDEPLGTSQAALTCAPSVTTRVSAATSGAVANDFSLGGALNSDARWVAFGSLATNLVSGDTNATFDVFLRDRLTGNTSRVSVSTGGTQANGPSLAPALSGDGNLVVFASDATNLVSSDTNQAPDIFLREVAAAKTTRVSVTTGGTQANGANFAPAISADGKFIAYHSVATNLVSADSNNASDVFLFERATGNTTRVSITSGGTQGNGDSWDPAISSDGRFVAFSSAATNLVSGDTNGVADIFMWDRTSKAISRVSVTSSGGQVNGASASPTVSGDGRYVAFEADATNLVSGDTNNVTDIFVRDRTGNTTTRVSVSTSGGQVNQASLAPSISADGRYVGFVSDATNLVSGDGNAARDVFVRDRTGNQTTRVSLASDGSSADGASALARLSGDGKAIVFQSVAANLVSGGICHATDIYVRDLGAPVAPWTLNVQYAIGDLVSFNGRTYQALQAHKSTVGWEPDKATDLWSSPTPCGVTAWLPQTIYVVGSTVTFNGNTYRAIQAHTSQVGSEPNVAPALWQVVP
jgi:hypothetical protein